MRRRSWRCDGVGGADVCVRKTSVPRPGRRPCPFEENVRVWLHDAVLLPSGTGDRGHGIYSMRPTRTLAASPASRCNMMSSCDPRELVLLGSNITGKPSLHDCDLLSLPTFRLNAARRSTSRSIG
ncbi:hypothetical protein L1887_58088 [Cichorium endivia]|nr:hypothetical protein L1887_58088 [Cichorium endivia]